MEPDRCFDRQLVLRATETPNRWMCDLTPLVLTPRRTLQGGAGLAAALLAMERVSGRPTIWATAQYLSFAVGTDPVQLDVTIEAVGHNTTQARCVLSRDGNEILTAHAALGSRPFDRNATWVTRPEVAVPEDCRPFDFFIPGRGDLADLAELRLASGRQIRDLRGVPGANASSYWVRVTTGRHDVGVGELAFIGDVLPVACSEPYGALYSGTSIDNTVRFGERASTEWILLDCRIEQVANGFGYGHAYLWSEDGVLLGSASQTMVMRFT